MLMEVKKHLKLIWLYFKVNLSSAMEYRASFLVQVFGMMINNLAFIFYWLVIFDKVGPVAGYEFKDVMFIWALASSSFGFAFVVFGNIRNLSGIIINGELDAYLLQPKDVYINVLCSRSLISAWGDLAYGFTLFIIVYGFKPLNLMMFTGFVILGGLLMGSVMVTADTLTFFIGNSSAIGRIVTEFLISFSIYPEGIFRGAVRWLFYSLVPAGFIVFMPLRIFRMLDWPYLVMLILIDAVYVVLGYLLFRAGLKRYESGNLITTKL